MSKAADHIFLYRLYVYKLYFRIAAIFTYQYFESRPLYGIMLKIQTHCVCVRERNAKIIHFSLLCIKQWFQKHKFSVCTLKCCHWQILFGENKKKTKNFVVSDVFQPKIFCISLSMYDADMCVMRTKKKEAILSTQRLGNTRTYYTYSTPKAMVVIWFLLPLYTHLGGFIQSIYIFLVAIDFITIGISFNDFVLLCIVYIWLCMCVVYVIFLSISISVLLLLLLLLLLHWKMSAALTRLIADYRFVCL